MVPNKENTELPSEDNQEATALPTESMLSDSEEDLDIITIDGPLQGVVPAYVSESR